MKKKVDAIYFSHLKYLFQGNSVQFCTDRPITELITDSRQITQSSAHALFIAIHGKHHDGHQYIEEAYSKGVRQFIVEQGKNTTYQHLQEVNILKTTCSIQALQVLVKYYRDQYTLPIIAITGSNGKTIVKEWLSQLLLACGYNVVKSPKSFNSQIGVPLSLWLIKSIHQYGIFEAGISAPGEMANLATMIQPQVGIFTNIGTAHDQFFLSIKQKIQEKILLFAHCKKIIYCKDHSFIDQQLQARFATNNQLISWSMHNLPDAKWHILQCYEKNNTLLTLHAGHIACTFRLPFQDKALIENAIHCLVFLLEEKMHSYTVIQQATEQLSTVPMRLTLKKGIANCQIIDDTYNNDLIGLQVALHFMLQQSSKLKKTIILSDMLQTGLKPEVLYTQIASLLKKYNIDRLIGIGTDISAHATLFHKLDTHFFMHVSEFCQQQPFFNQELILIKGARQLSLEKVVDHLQQKIHATVLEVNLDAIAHNLQFFHNKLAKHTKLMVVVKAFSYGSSIFEVASLLQHHKVDYLAVAYTDEGIWLREHGISLPIMIMNPTPASFDKLIHYNLEPEVYSVDFLQKLCNYVQKCKKNITIHCKIDSGMHRLGLIEEDIQSAMHLLQATKHIKVASIFSHLAAADMPKHDAYTHQQATKFLHIVQQITTQLQQQFPLHLLNSAGILRFPAYHFDMVRLGIGLYGVMEQTDQQINLEPASTLKTVVLQVKKIAAGATIGYHRAGIAKNNMHIAIIAIGYADGFTRMLSNGKGQVWINGYYAPVVGQVCMDTCMIDVTNLKVQEGDEVIIFGKELPLLSFAAMQDTTPYEVLTRISGRVKRLYFTN